MLISLDIDDVLASFFPAMCARSGKKCERINIWDGEAAASFVRLGMRKVENNSRFWLNLKTLSNPEDITFNFDYYLTSSPEAMVKHRMAWLIFNGFPRKPIIVSSDKVFEMQRLGIQVHIDDNPYTLDKIKAAGLIPIQFIPPYMSIEREDLNPIRHLSQVNEILKNL